MTTLSQRPGRIDLDVVRGDVAAITLSFVNGAGAPVDLSANTYVAALVTNDGSAVSGTTVTVGASGAATGVFTVSVSAATTALLTGESYWWRFRDSTNSRTLLDGVVNVKGAGFAGLSSGETSATVSITNSTAVATVTAAVASLGDSLRSGILHVTNLDITEPHPLGADLTPNVSRVELVSQDDPDENGTYIAPDDPATEPLVRVADADQLVRAGNIGLPVTFGLVMIGSTEWTGAHEFVVGADPASVDPLDPDPILAVQQGTSVVATAQTTADPAVGFDSDGARTANQLILGTSPDPGEDGLFRFVADLAPLVRVNLLLGYGVRVLVMVPHEEWVNSPHGGWLLWSEQGASAGDITSAISTHAGAADPHGDRAYTDTAVGGRVPTTRTVNGHALSADVTVTKSDVGLGSVDNTADTAKPVSTAQQTALDLKADKSLTSNTQTASYTLVLSDAGKVVEMNVAGANDLTVPLNSSVAFPIGTVIGVYQMGAGLTTIVATGGVTIRNVGAMSGQYAEASLRKRATDEWVLTGSLA